MHKYNTKITFEILDAIGEYRLVEKSPDEYCADVELCCGPSDQQTQEAGAAQSLSQSMTAAFNDRLATQTGVLKNINNLISPIASAGPSQQGMSPQELAALNTTAINTSAAATRNALQATRGALAGRGGGGTSGLESGVDQSIEANIRSQGAQQLGAEETGIQKLNYDIGRQNFWQAQGGLQALAGEESPWQAGNEAVSSGQSAFQDATKIQDMKNQKQAAIAGAIASGAMDAASFGSGAMTSQGFDLQGGLQALSGH